ncbi:piggyBac transposable element-derived protein 3-like [Helicoverpa zea]|uniref:piggyBac transposable element-derived protein 3-like n=1 Tax=Helicoverpa zea TaxID=7113 RepID=UPI001F5AD107|nr:piggyBac transposable element-derived protein 3-like [Helicoverpa zea]
MANDRPLAAHEILDALENVSDNEEDYRERLICILPPPVDPDCLTDEDSGEEDNVTLNNLPRNILLQPAEVMIQGQIMVSDTEEEPSDSTGRTKRRRTYAWRKRDLAKNAVNWPDVQGACQDKRPIEWFENFLDEDVISLLVSESNKYAVKKNLPGDITTEDMKCFIGILLVSGYSWLPRRRMYWENSPDTKNELISSAMTRDRFDFIFRHLHVNDNLDLQDKYTKVRPLVTLLNKKFLEFSPLEEHYSVDEAMIPYYGRHGCKQHIKGINPKQSAKRFSQSEKRNIVIEEPHMVSIYNKYMGGVDRSDENISHYRIGIRALHVNPTFKSKMKVKLAAQVLSNTVAAILKHMAEKYGDSVKAKEILETAQIMIDFFRLYQWSLLQKRYNQEQKRKCLQEN